MPASPDPDAGLTRDLLAAGLVDTHYHIGPEAVPRRYDLGGLAADAGDATVVLKNHGYATTPLATLARAHHDVAFLGGVVLNRFVGGLNPDAVVAAAAANRPVAGSPGRTEPPMVVWMPTVHARAHLDTFGYEYDPRWYGGPSPANGRRPSPVDVFEPDGLPVPQLPDVLDAIAAAGARLATGHLSADEVTRIVPMALDAGVPAVLITHPSYPSVGLSDDDLVTLTRDPRVFVEHCLAVHTIEGIALERFATSIIATGPGQVVVASDFGQVVSGPFPNAAFPYAGRLAGLLRDRVRGDAFIALFSHNGRRALGLDEP